MRVNFCASRALLALFLSGCSAQQSASPEDQTAAWRAHESVGYINGTAKVVSVDKTIGLATLEFQGQPVQAYWLMETDLAEGGTLTTISPLQPQVGRYEKPTVRAQSFDAGPGDTIAFVGLRTGDDILLRGIKVIARGK